MFSNNFSNNLPKEYSCLYCDVNMCSKRDYNRHIKTKKHLSNLQQSSAMKISSEQFTCVCCKKYADYSGLWRHKKTCSKLISPLSPPIYATNEQKQQLFTDEMVMELIKQNKELQTLLLEQQKMVMEQSTKICSLIQTPTNNNTNL
jgi:cell fate (sporulation/competence/biofilm development) regulator YlbF (YheA/YmcA/DUF963 family)